MTVTSIDRQPASSPRPSLVERWLTPIIYPAACPVCGAAIRRNGEVWCPACRRLMVVLPAAVCPVCRRYRRFDYVPCPNGHDPSTVVSVRVLGVFDAGWRATIHAFKYGGRRFLANALGLELSDAVGSHISADVVAAVPTAGQHIRERGYGHAETLAEFMAARLGLPFVRNGLKLVRRVADQTRLSGRERFANLSGAFSVITDSSVASKTVIVVDDVMTTGATILEAGRALLAAGARSVCGAVLAINMGRPADL